MKSKLTIIICSILGVLAITGVILFLVLGNNTVTITFDSDGGSKVEKLEVKKGETAKLPTPTKENNQFDGWYYKDSKVDEKFKFNESLTLKAHWTETVTIKVTFETNGGTKIDPIFLAKDEEFTEPTAPTKEGYTFYGWYDQNEVSISTGALFAEDITLYAKWEKEVKKYTVNFDSNGGSKVNSVTVNEGAKLTLPKDPTKENSKFVGWYTKNNTVVNSGTVVKENMTLYAHWQTYTCPSGYTLKDTKCTTEVAAKTKCADGLFEYEGKCVTVNYTVRKDPTKECGKKTVILPYGHTEEVKGELFQMGTYYCYYKEVTDSYEQQNSSNCTSRSHKWNSKNSRCYYDRDDANVNITNSCNSGYVYIGNPNQFNGVNGLNGGCFPTKDKQPYCDKEYTLSNGKCVKTIDATLK